VVNASLEKQNQTAVNKVQTDKGDAMHDTYVDCADLKNTLLEFTAVHFFIVSSVEPLEFSQNRPFGKIGTCAR